MTIPPIGYTLPTSRSFEGMKAVLFRPFDIGKWFVLGFSAWLAGLLDGGGSGGGGGGDLGTGAGSADDMGSEVGDVFHSIAQWITDNLGLVIVIGTALLLIGLAIFLVLLWVSSRGKFMFLDNVLHNRALVAEPWTRFRAQGNSLFLWRLVFSAIILMIVLITGGAIAFCAIGLQESGVMLFPLVLSILLLVLAAMAAGYVGTLLEDFVIPLMHRDSLSATAAWGRFLALHRVATGRFILYALWKLVLGLAALLAVLIAGFGTCCIGFLIMAIPYLGAVLLLPVSVFFRLLGPQFLGQFGPDFDVFPNPATTETP
jgi:hypothetical protein